jgi:hypothetical protein
VAEAVVAIADYAAIRKDIPFLEKISQQDIDSYFLANFAFFSKKHIDFTRQSSGYRINTKIPVTGVQKTALRPPFYGRALMVPAEKSLAIQPDKKSFVGLPKGPLMDIKGAGNPEPELVEDHHGNGQAYFGEAMREYHFQKLVQLIFDNEQKGWQTNPVYAVILLPFSAEHDLGTQLRSALIVRKADFRHGKFTNHGGFVFYSKDNVLQNDAFEESAARELALRKYGLTSTVEMKLGERNEFEAVNLQYTRTMSLIDFGSFGVLDSFQHQLQFCNPQYKGDPNKSKEPLRYTGFTVQDCPYKIEKNEPRFVQKPNFALAVSKSLWGLGPITQNALKLIPEKNRPGQRVQFLDNPSLAGTWLASSFETNSKVGKADALLQHCRFIMPVVQKLKMNVSTVPSAQLCNPIDIKNAEFNIQVQATLALKSMVNAETLESIVEENFSDFRLENIGQKSLEMGRTVFQQWEKFLRD